MIMNISSRSRQFFASTTNPRLSSLTLTPTRIWTTLGVMLSTVAAPVESMATPRGETFAKALPALRPFHRRLFLLRHGQTDWNKQGLMQGGGFDIPLNSNGQQQASQVANELSAIPLGVIASSHLQRAMQTATAVHASDYDGDSSLPRLVDARFGEMRFGDFEGTCIHGPNAELDTKERFQTMFEAMKQNVNLPWPGKDAECTLQVSKRGQAAVDTLLDQYADVDQLAVVAHGRFNKILLATLLWKDPSRYVEIEQGNTCINVVDFNEQSATWSPILLNYYDHAPNANAKKELNRLANEQQQQQQQPQIVATQQL